MLARSTRESIGGSIGCGLISANVGGALDGSSGREGAVYARGQQQQTGPAAAASAGDWPDGASVPAGSAGCVGGESAEGCYSAGCLGDVVGGRQSLEDFSKTSKWDSSGEGPTQQWQSPRGNHWGATWRRCGGRLWFNKAKLEIQASPLGQDGYVLLAMCDEATMDKRRSGYQDRSGIRQWQGTSLRRETLEPGERRTGRRRPLNNPKRPFTSSPKRPDGDNIRQMGWGWIWDPRTGTPRRFGASFHPRVSDRRGRRLVSHVPPQGGGRVCVYPQVVVPMRAGASKVCLGGGRTRTRVAGRSAEQQIRWGCGEPSDGSTGEGRGRCARGGCTTLCPICASYPCSRNGLSGFPGCTGLHTIHTSDS